MRDCWRNREEWWWSGEVKVLLVLDVKLSLEVSLRPMRSSESHLLVEMRPRFEKLHMPRVKVS